jgi:hypothetical protein
MRSEELTPHPKRVKNGNDVLSQSSPLDSSPSTSFDEEYEYSEESGEMQIDETDSSISALASDSINENYDESVDSAEIVEDGGQSVDVNKILLSNSLQQAIRRFYSTTSSVYAEQTITNPNVEQLLFWLVIFSGSVYTYSLIFLSLKLTLLSFLLPFRPSWLLTVCQR